MSKKSSTVIISQMFKAIITAQIIANITPSLASISNGLLIGNSLSPTAMAALSFVSPTGGLFAAMAAVISLGANILCGNFIGQGKTKEINRIFTTAVFTITAIGATLTLYTESCPARVAGLLGANGEALPETIAYLRGLCVGTLPTLLVPCLVVFLNMANEITYAMFSTVILAAVNLIAGFVNLRILGGGMFGMGLASAISEYAALLFLLIRFVRKKHVASIEWKGFVPAYTGKIILLGSPSALMFFLYSIRNIQINRISFETGGTAAVTALGILHSSAGIFDAVNTGIGSTLVMLASIMAGEQDRESLYKLLKYTMTFGLLIVLIKTAVYAALAHPIAALFGAEGSDSQLAVACIYAYALCMPFNLLPTAIIKIYQCLNRVFLSNVIYGFTCIVFPIGIMYALRDSYGIYGVWSCYMLSEVLTILMLFLICLIKNGRFPRSYAEWLWLNKTFPVSAENQASFTVCERNGISESAAKIKSFFTAHGFSEQESEGKARIACIILNQIYDADFDKKKNPITEIFMNIRENGVSIRFRDNSPTCNIIPALMEDEFIAAHPHGFSYHSVFGMNVLTLETQTSD